MRKIVFDLGAAVRSEWPWQGKNTKIQALNGKDIDVHHFALLALAGAPWKFDAAWSAPLEARQQSFPSRRPWNPILSQLTENRDRCEFHVATIDIGSGFISSPGFTIQQDGRSPSLTIIFEDLKTAEQCASSMREIIDKATA